MGEEAGPKVSPSQLLREAVALVTDYSFDALKCHVSTLAETVNCCVSQHEDCKEETIEVLKAQLVALNRDFAGYVFPKQGTSRIMYQCSCLTDEACACCSSCSVHLVIRLGKKTVGVVMTVIL